jgi:hypothetical protein
VLVIRSHKSGGIRVDLHCQPRLLVAHEGVVSFNGSSHIWYSEIVDAMAASV